MIRLDEFVFNALLREVINASSLREACLAHVRWTAYAVMRLSRCFLESIWLILALDQS